MIQQMTNTVGRLSAFLSDGFLRLRIAMAEKFLNKRILIGKLHFKFTDAQSFYMEYKDIFINKIYDFETDADVPIIIDGGGCIGMAALFFKKKYPNSKLTVFEPDLSLARIIEDNVKVNHLSDVRVVAMGISDRSGFCDFVADGGDGGCFAADSASSGEHASSRVQVEKLSKHIVTKVDLLKLNIEGQELPVLRDLEETGKLPLVAKIILEYHGWPGKRQALGDILNLLETNGFRYILHDFDAITNPASKPPFRVLPEATWFCLVAAERKRP